VWTNSRIVCVATTRSSHPHHTRSIRTVDQWVVSSPYWGDPGFKYRPGRIYFHRFLVAFFGVSLSGVIKLLGRWPVVKDILCYEGLRFYSDFLCLTKGPSCELLMNALNEPSKEVPRGLNPCKYRNSTLNRPWPLPLSSLPVPYAHHTVTTLNYEIVKALFNGSTWRDSSVGIVTRLRAGRSDDRVWFPAGAGNFSFRHRVETGFGTHPASYPIGTGGSFPRGKAVGALSWPLTSI
jgi:hypothetical protein